MAAPPASTKYGWQLYPMPNSYSSTTLAEQVSYSYDNDSRMTGLTEYGYGGLAYGVGYGSGYGGSYGGTFTLEQYSLEYDADSRIEGLTNFAHNSDNATYLYDADSELATALSYGGAYGGQYTGNDQTSSIYDPNGNPTGTGVGIGAGNRLLSDGTYNYTYDAAGNMLSQTNITSHVAMTFTYDADNRLSTVVMLNATGQTTANISLTYDLYGSLIGRSATTFVYSGGTTYSTTTTGHFVYDPVTNDMVLAFDGSGNLTDRFLYGPAVDEILAQENVGSPLNANTTWMATNYQGSVVNNLWQGDTRYGSNPSSNVSYSPFGQTNFAGGLFFGYTGAYTDPLTAMQYHSVGDDGRWTTANGQRWIQPDPTGLGPDSNPYRVCGNNPTNGTDPTGLFTFWGHEYVMPWNPDASWNPTHSVFATATEQVAGEGMSVATTGSTVPIATADQVTGAAAGGAADGGSVVLDTLSLGNVAHDRSQAAQERAAKNHDTLAQIGFGAGKIGARSLQAAAVIGTGGAIASAATTVAGTSATGAAIVGTIGTAAEVATPTLTVIGAGATIQQIQAANENFQRGNVAAATDNLGNAAFTGALTAAPFVPGGGAARSASSQVTGRVAELNAAIPAGAQGRITMAVGVVEDSNGVRSVLIGTSEPGGYLRPGVSLAPGETMVSGTGHAEADIISYAKANGLKVIDIGATRPICPDCQEVIAPTGANISTPLKARPGG